MLKIYTHVEEQWYIIGNFAFEVLQGGLLIVTTRDCGNHDLICSFYIRQELLLLAEGEHTRENTKCE